MRSSAKYYDELRAYIETIPLIDCHDHSEQAGPKHTDPIRALVDFYMRSDLVSASSDRDVDFILDENIALEQRWPVLERAWQRTKHTAYARVLRNGMRRFYGETELTLAALLRMRGRLLDFSDPHQFEAVLDEAGILVRLEDTLPSPAVLIGELKLTPRSRPVISLPAYHAVCSQPDVQSCASPLGAHITSLEEYLQACRTIFERLKQLGAVAFKDQSAYERPIDYGNPTYAEAEAAFNWFMQDPRRRLSYPDGNRPLGDYLFNQFMCMARELDLPVQIHTGHMAGIRNDVAKTNAVLLTSLIERHRETRFDLFHANWPYSGEMLYLGKNYPNVAIDFCWANMIDPLYCQNMFKQAVMTVPHAKIHGYGSDLSGNALPSAWAHAQMARDNITIALADLIDMEYLDLDEAKEIAAAWLFDNANAFFKLGMRREARIERGES
jgi:hypothetical protein